MPAGPRYKVRLPQSTPPKWPQTGPTPTPAPTPKLSPNRGRPSSLFQAGGLLPALPGVHLLPCSQGQRGDQVEACTPRWGGVGAVGASCWGWICLHGGLELGLRCGAHASARQATAASCWPLSALWVTPLYAGWLACLACAEAQAGTLSGLRYAGGILLGTLHYGLSLGDNAGGLDPWAPALPSTLGTLQHGLLLGDHADAFRLEEAARAWLGWRVNPGCPPGVHASGMPDALSPAIHMASFFKYACALGSASACVIQ